MSLLSRRPYADAHGDEASIARQDPQPSGEQSAADSKSAAFEGSNLGNVANLVTAQGSGAGDASARSTGSDTGWQGAHDGGAHDGDAHLAAGDTALFEANFPRGAARLAGTDDADMKALLRRSSSMEAAGARASTSLAGPDRAAVQHFESCYRSGSRGLTLDGYRSKAGAGVMPLTIAALGRHSSEPWDAMSTVASPDVSGLIKIGNTEEAAASWNVGIDQVRGWWDHTLTLPKIDEIRQHNIILDLNSIGGQNATSKLILLLKVKRALANSYGAGESAPTPSLLLQVLCVCQKERCASPSSDEPARVCHSDAAEDSEKVAEGTYAQGGR